MLPEATAVRLLQATKSTTRLRHACINAANSLSNSARSEADSFEKAINATTLAEKELYRMLQDPM